MKGEIFILDILNKDNLKIMISGPNGSGKSTQLLERYKYMVEKLKIPSSEILILLLNRTQSLEWRTRTVLKSSGVIWRTSYYGFIQKEISNFYPLILQKCENINSKRIKPVFLTFESAQFLFSVVIGKRRERDGIFNGLTAYTDKISIDLTSNLVRAATSNINYNEIGDRLYNSLEFKDDIKKKIFQDSDNILKAYRKKCMELGVFDFGTAIEFYINVLLKNDDYTKMLKKRIKHLIVDNIEECVPTEIDFIEYLIPSLSSCVIAYNSEGGYGEAFGSNIKYMEERLINKFDEIKLNKTYTCDNEMAKFADELYYNIQNTNDEEIINIKPLDYNIQIERNPTVDLRCEMLEMVANRIISLLEKDKYQPRDIVVVSTYADPVTEYVIGRILEKNGYFIKNLTRRNKVIENPFSQALVTLAKLCHPQFELIPSRDEINSLLRMLLKIDPIRSSILAGEINSFKPFAVFPDIEFPNLIERIGFLNIEKYKFIREWIENYKLEKELPINEFFQKVFLEILINKEVSQEDISQSKNLIDSAQNFIEVISKFNRNANKDFLEMLNQGIKAAESIYELEEKINGGFVLLSTPVAFLASSIRAKVIIISGLSSDNWSPRSIKELTNNHVLTKTWDHDQVYTEDLEIKNQKNYLAVTMRALIKNCKDKLITFESNISSSGFENDGNLSLFFEQLLGGNQNGT